MCISLSFYLENKRRQQKHILRVTYNWLDENRYNKIKWDGVWLLCTIYIGWIWVFNLSRRHKNARNKESDGSCLMSHWFSRSLDSNARWMIIIRIPSAAHTHARALFACCWTWNSCANCTSVESSVLPNLDGDECIQYLLFPVHTHFATLAKCEELNAYNAPLTTHSTTVMITGECGFKWHPFLTHQIAYVRTLITHCSIMMRLLLHSFLLVANVDYNGVFYDRIHTYFNYQPLNVKDQNWRNWNHFDIPMPWLKSERQLARAENTNNNNSMHVSISVQR